MDYSTVKLGKLAPRHDERTLRLAEYLDLSVLPKAPDAISFASKVPQWPMYANDRLGDCTAAACAHLIEVWTAVATSKVREVPESAVVDMYEAITGGQDTGAVELDVLRYWRKTGLAGDRITAFAAVDPDEHEHVKLSILLFGGAYIGIALPITAQQQTGPGKVWDIIHGPATADEAPGSWGGHAVNVVGYDKDGLTVVTWGALQRMTWDFWAVYVDECWAILPKEWAKGIPGFAYKTLVEDLVKVGQVSA